MNLQQLRYLVAAVDHGTMTSAAAAMHVSQPALTRSVRSLEREIGVPLFERVGRGVRLTPAGREVVQSAYRIIEGKGATNYAVGLAGTRIIEAVLDDEHRILPVSTLLDGAYGLDDVCLSLPTLVDGEPAPDRTDEYRFYQALIGVWPPELGVETLAAPDDVVSRLTEYMIKAAKEAKVHTSWLTPNEPYEEALRTFVRRALTGSTGGKLLAALLPFQRKIAHLGIVNSLAQYEVHVARYYFTRGAYVAAINRAQVALADYRDVPALEEALFLLMQSYDALGMTQLRDDARRVLEKNYPQSAFLGRSAPRSTRPWWQFW